MSFAFDLISDLNVDAWPEALDWSYQATSPICIIAGNVSDDLAHTRAALAEIAQHYHFTVYIDGNLEHVRHGDRIGENYQDLAQALEGIDKLIYLQDNVVVLNNVAIVGTNGWWNWDFDPSCDIDQAQKYWCQKYHYNVTNVDLISRLAQIDAMYVTSTMTKLQHHDDVESIVMVTNSVPRFDLVQHDESLTNSYEVSVMGNSDLEVALSNDTHGKTRVWCVGRYPGQIDTVRDGVRFVNNYRGRPDDAWNQIAYFPKRIEIS